MGTLLAARSAGTWRISRASRWRFAPAKPTPRTSAYIAWLEERPDADGALREPRARDFAARDFKRYLKLERGWAPSSVNLALAAIDHFNRFLGLGPAIVTRERLAQSAPRSLDEDQQRGLMRAAEHASPRDRAIVVLLLHTGLRLSELVALDVGDVRTSARKRVVIVRSGKGDAFGNRMLTDTLGAALERLPSTSSL